MLGLAAVILSAGFLAVLLVTMVMNGASGFLQTRIALPIDFPRAGLMLDPNRLHGPGADLALAGAGIERATDDAAIAAGMSAADVMREIAPIVGGGGGGKPGMARAGGKDPSKMAEAMARASELLRSAAA